MIVNVLEIFTEYLSIILCMHKIAKKNIEFNSYVFLFSLLNFLSVFVAHKYHEENRYLMSIMYINLLIYVKMRLSKKWIDAIKIFFSMFVIIPCLQLVFYYFVKFLFLIIGIVQVQHIIAIVANCIICLVIMKWKKQYLAIFSNLITKSRGLCIMIIYAFLSIFLVYLYKESDYVYENITLQSLIMIMGVGVVSILWMNAESEKKMKAKELQLYETYNRTFEEAITAIRIRQHEFDNHINAIKCLQITIDNPIDLVKAQNDYCNKILQENSFNRLLKVRTEPILIGFLYSKFMGAKEKGIEILHEVHAIELNDVIEITELIEVIGILFDNAVEALLEINDVERKIVVKILQEDVKKVYIEVANISKKYLNSDIEKFCICGYSTKGEKRGIGLSRVKDIIKGYKADFCIENVNYNGDNYLSFKILLF